MVDIGASWMLVEKISLRCFGEVYQERLVRYLKVFLTAPKGIVEYIQELHFQLLPVTFAELRVNVHLVYPPENQSVVTVILLLSRLTPRKSIKITSRKSLTINIKP